MNSTEHTLFFCGDFFVSSDADMQMIPSLFDFAEGSPVLANLEGACPTPNSSPARFTACPLSLSDELSQSLPSNVLLTVANNHSLDFGKESLLYTQKVFQPFLLNIGKDEVAEAMGQRLVFMVDEREGCDARSLGCYPFSEAAISTIEGLSESIVIVHGGIEYRDYPTPVQKRIAEALIDNGAQAVVFHHSHVPGVICQYKHRFIFYGLGNFFFSEVMGLHGEKSESGLILRLDIPSLTWSVMTANFGSDGRLKAGCEFVPATSLALTKMPTRYVEFYRERYPLDSSLRPRQLDRYEWWLNIKFKIWLGVARALLYFGLTKKIKRVIAVLKRK